MGRLAERGGRRRLERGRRAEWTAVGSARAAGNSGGAAAADAALREQMAVVAAQRDTLQRALGDAAQVQRRLSGPRQLRRGEFEIAGESFPAQHVSGDLLTTFDTGEHTVFAIGDICGKGLFAGMWFTHVAGLIRMLAQGCSDPAKIAEGINSHLASLPAEPPLATLFLGRLHAGTGELAYCNAGHPAPLLLRAEGQMEELETGGPVLGAVGGAAFKQGQAWLAPGDTLIGYSDGVVECRNRNNQDFEAERLGAAAAAAARSASAILFSVLGATQDFAAAQPRADDIALLVIHRLAGRAQAN